MLRFQVFFRMLSLWALLLAPELASARTLVDAKTRVGVFEVASELCIRDSGLANSSRHQGNVDASTENASRYPHAARGAASLSDDIAKTFARGKFHTRVLQQDVVAYRYSGGVSGPTGRFLTTGQTVQQIGSPAAAQRLLNLPSGATAEQLNALVIPKGTTIFYGRVAGGGPTATQIFIQDASVLRAVP